MKNYTLTIVMIAFITFILFEHNKDDTCGGLCVDMNVQHYHDIDKQFTKKKKREKYVVTTNY